jgi:ankyrin repeat protein
LYRWTWTDRVDDRCNIPSAGNYESLHYRKEIDPTAADVFGHSALTTAALRGNAQEVELLIENPDVNVNFRSVRCPQEVRREIAERRLVVGHFLSAYQRGVTPLA